MKAQHTTIPTTIYQLADNTPRNIATLYKYREMTIHSMELFGIAVVFKCGVYDNGVTSVTVGSFGSKTDKEAQALFLLCSASNFKRVGTSELAISFVGPTEKDITEAYEFALA